MKAAVLVEGPQLVLQERPTPEPGPNEVVVKVHRAAICGTDFSRHRGHVHLRTAPGARPRVLQRS